MSKVKGTVSSRHNLKNRKLTFDTRILMTAWGSGRALIHLPMPNDLSRCASYQDAEYIFYGTLRNAEGQGVPHLLHQLTLCRGCFREKSRQRIPVPMVKLGA